MCSYSCLSIISAGIINTIFCFFFVLQLQMKNSYQCFCIMFLLTNMEFLGNKSIYIPNHCTRAALWTKTLNNRYLLLGLCANDSVSKPLHFFSTKRFSPVRAIHLIIAMAVKRNRKCRFWSYAVHLSLIVYYIQS